MKQSNNAVLLVISAVAALAALFSFFSDYSLPIAALVSLVLALFIFWQRPIWGIYLMAATFPFLQWQVVVGSLNAPIVDIVALILFLVYALQNLWRGLNGNGFFKKEDFFGLGLFLIFFAAGAISLLNTSAADFNDSLKYLLRPILYFYLMFVVLPVAYIKEWKQLDLIVRIIYFVGLVFAVLGMYKFIFWDPSMGMRRTIPFGFGSFFPLGYNHNLLAEALIGVLPISIYLITRGKELVNKYLYALGGAVIFLAAFLTFSRAGWIALMVEVGLVFVLLFKKQLKSDLYRLFSWIAALMVIPFGIILYYLNSTPIAQGSNLNRLKLIEIALDLFKEHPFFGAGVGMFFKTVEQVRWYIIEYGGALDAHGVFFKVIAETGIVGVVGYFSFVIYCFWFMYRSWKNSKNTEMQLLGALLAISAIGIFVFQWFGTSYYVGKLWFPMGLAIVAAKLANPSNSTNSSKK